MLNIGICDSNAAHRNQLQKVLTALLFDTVEIRVTQFPSGQALLTAMENRTLHIDLLFLEIALPDMNGLRVASSLRAAAYKADIIFLTELERYVYDGYIYHAYDYLIKPISAKKIGVCIRRYISEKFGAKESYLTIASKGHTERLNLRKVRYFESRQRKIAAIMEDRTVEFYQKMGDLFQVIQNAGFIRCHQSYVVNTAQIAALQSSELLLLDGTPLPVSKRYLPDIRTLMQNSSIQGGA